MSLKTDYKDDILAVGNLRKYQMIQNNDGTVSFQDVTQYEQTGDVFGAGDINRTNQAVNEKFDSGDVVDPMLTTEPGFAADAYQTKLQFDEQNKKLNNEYYGIVGSLFASTLCNSLSRKGNQVNILLVFDTTMTRDTTVLGKLPSDFIPSTTRYVSGKCSIGEQWLPLSFRLEPNGNIYANEYEGLDLQNLGIYGTYFL